MTQDWSITFLFVASKNRISGIYNAPVEYQNQEIPLRYSRIYNYN